MAEENKVEVAPEELAAEQEALQVPKVEEIRAKVIEDFGFDATADAEKIEKAVTKEVDHRERLSKTIAQKIKYREAGKTPVKPVTQTTNTEAKKPEEDRVSTADLYALVEAKVPQADIAEVSKAAKLLGKTIPEALQDSMVQSILVRRSEERTTANAASTKGSQRTTNKTTDSDLLQNLSKGIIPEKGSEEAERLFFARRKRKN